jgi:cytochrome b
LHGPPPQGARALFFVSLARVTHRATPVWDLPTRLTHWLFALCVAFSWWSAEQRLMDWHRYSGYTVLGLLIFRIYWGIAGSSTARFAHFVGTPRAVLEHLRLRREQRTRIVGHSPLGSWSVVAMLLAMATQVTLGLFATDIDGLESGPLSHLVTFDTGRTLAEAHEVSFNVLLALIALHVVAILFYLLYERNDLVTAMLSGRKRVEGEPPGMRPAPGWRLVDGRGARHARRVADRCELTSISARA